MKSLPLKTIAEHIGGKLLRGNDDMPINKIVTQIATEGYSLRKGTMIFDSGHTDVASAISHCPSECAAVTENPAVFTGSRAAVVAVQNVEKAYWNFIDFYRGLYHIPVIGVTGTCGKTTTKEMIYHILSKKHKVAATYKSYNAIFRHLHYLCNLDDDIEAAVFEMGVAAPGDLKVSGRYFRPTIGIITNIGVDHLQAFDTLDGYIRAKSEMTDALNNEGTLLLNADDENIAKIDLSPYRGKVLYFGKSPRAQFKLLHIEQKNENVLFGLRYKDKIYHFSVRGYGEFTAYNAVAAIAAAHAAGFKIREAGDGLSDFNNIERHFEIKKGIKGSTVIDDTWSTNPTSAENALMLLKELSEGKKTVAALGKMSLLGKQSSSYHFKIGEIAAETGIDDLLILGNGAGEIGLGAIYKGMDKKHIYFCKDPSETEKILKQLLDENTVALIKTSMLATYENLIHDITVSDKV